MFALVSILSVARVPAASTNRPTATAKSAELIPDERFLQADSGRDANHSCYINYTADNDIHPFARA
jgi:hypothetical protein